MSIRKLPNPLATPIAGHNLDSRTLRVHWTLITIWATQATTHMHFKKTGTWSVPIPALMRNIPGNVKA